jgi:O-antigen/teichoic acid export membrane protein
LSAPGNHTITRGLLLADNVLFSVANFVLAISLARSYAEFEFAALGVALALALAIQSAQKSLYIVRVSLMPPDAARRSSGAIIAQHIMVVAMAVACVCIVTAVGVAAGASEQFKLIGLSTIVCYLIYFQADFDRALLLKLGSALRPALLSLSYLLAVTTLAALARWRGLSFVGFMTGLIIFTLAKGCLVMIALVGARPRWRAGRRLLALDWRRYGMPAVMGAANNAGFLHIPVMLLATLRGPLEVGVLVAMRTLMQPLMVIIRSLDAGDKNRFHSRASGTVAGVRHVFWRTFALYAAIGLAALLVLSLTSNLLIHLVYKNKFGGHPELLIEWCVYAIFLTLAMPIQSVVYLIHRQHQLMWWGTISSIVGLCIAICTCGPLGAQGAMLSTLCGAALGVIGGLWTIRDVAISPVQDSAEMQSVTLLRRKGRRSENQLGPPDLSGRRQDR